MQHVFLHCYNNRLLLPGLGLDFALALFFKHFLQISLRNRRKQLQKQHEKNVYFFKCLHFCANRLRFDNQQSVVLRHTHTPTHTQQQARDPAPDPESRTRT